MTPDLVPQPSSCQLPGGRSYFLQVLAFPCQELELVAIETALYSEGRGEKSLPHCLTWLSVLYVSVCVWMCLFLWSDLMNECVISLRWRWDVMSFCLCERKTEGKRNCALINYFSLYIVKSKLSCPLPYFVCSLCPYTSTWKCVLLIQFPTYECGSNNLNETRCFIGDVP